MTITLRATKGSALTHNETDANFETLKGFRDAAISLSDPDYGANGDGSTDDLANLQSFDDNTGIIKIIPPGDYKLSADWLPPAGDYSQLTSPDVTFVTNRPDFENVIPYQGSPGDLWAPNLFAKTYGAPWAGFGNIFNLGSFVDAAITTVPIVAVFGEGDASVDGARTWGGNFVGFASASGAVSIATEFNLGVLASGGTAYGIVIAAAGDYATENYIQVQANTDDSIPDNGIVFNATDRAPATGALITFTGSTGATAARLMKFDTFTFTSSEWETKCFIVGPSPSSATANWQRVRIDHSTTGNPSIKAVATDATASNLNIYSNLTGSVQFLTGSTPAIQVQVKDAAGAPDYLTLTGGSGGAVVSINGTTTNASVIVKGKGAAGVLLRGGDDGNKIQVNNAGIGFFAATPAAKQTVTGSRGSNAALASLITAMANLGLVTDSSS